MNHRYTAPRVYLVEAIYRVKPNANRHAGVNGVQAAVTHGHGHGTHSPGMMLARTSDANKSGVPRDGRNSSHAAGSTGHGPTAGGDGGGVAPDRQPSGVTLGFSDAIVSALAQKKLDEAKRTKQELMAERMMAGGV